MESTRRPFNRSLSKEPGLKKPRLTEDHAAADRSSNVRTGFVQRPALPNSGLARVQRDRDSESSGAVRGLYQQQPGHQLHQELVNQYKTALSELTFNSKPIITNLTIIAGENSHAAKAIAATVCANILEVPREQKLPSLYLLDSIVKNIGRDYIKYFASRLPEVFCKAYRQVDPPIHQGMRHLFGTWKGVFPPQTLQMIEKELGFTTTANGSSSGTTTSRPDSQAQRSAHSIHVNPKYLEARQRLQPTRAKGSGSDISGTLVSSPDDVEPPARITTISSKRSWADPYTKSIQHHQKDKVNEPVRDKSSTIRFPDSKYGSSISGHESLGTERVSEKFKEPGLDRPWYESATDVTGKVSNQSNGFHMEHEFESYPAHQSANSDSHLLLKQNFASRKLNGVSRSWKNSEEEEYVWDEMNTRPTDLSAANTSAKDNWTPDDTEKLDFGGHIRRPQSIHDIGPRVDDEISTDSLSTEIGHVASGAQVPLSWSEELHIPEGNVLLGPGKNISGYSEGYSTQMKSSANTVGRTPYQPQVGPDPTGGLDFNFSTNVMPGPKVSMMQQEHTLGTASLMKSTRHQRPPSPSVSAHNPNRLHSSLAERNQGSTGPPTDPRRPPGQRNTGSLDQSHHRDVYQSSTQRFQPHSIQTSPAAMPPLQQRKYVPSTQQRKLEVSEFGSSGNGQNLLSIQISGSESHSTIGNSSSDLSNPLTVDSPGQSINSSLLTGVTKTGMIGSTSLMDSSTKLDSEEVELVSSPGMQPSLQSDSHPASFLSSPPLHENIPLPGFSKEKSEQPPVPSAPHPSSLGSEQIPSTANPTSNPVSSLLSSLVAKGLISASKSDSLSSASTQKPDQSLNYGPGVSSTSSTPDSSVPLTMRKPLLSITDQPSSSRPVAEISDGLRRPKTNIKDTIGFEFRPDVVRNLHPDVITDLVSDLPYQCRICGLRLKLQEPLDRHMEWHALRAPDQNPLNKNSRRWYTSSVDWVAGVGYILAADSPSDLSGESGAALTSSEQMVPADESQCACILCGELFEDCYSQETKEWMFKKAVYLNIQSSESQETIGTASDTASPRPIVHINCMSEDILQDLGLACDVELEKDAA
ncbi:polyadenylation and cleavage factor homolog 4 isoform X1 [Sesamum indicum]|uniref:Polyadenylation and cleavage factor homolog 4 isoform X1 n=1 Tax=Sesamum indicum TaxID=4182 RepID=A0A6I9U9R4_SESIN|nr:polyadenylation and cleavage factor homolog 4 isoform X1 [Sesamum indicum]